MILAVSAILIASVALPALLALWGGTLPVPAILGRLRPLAAGLRRWLGPLTLARPIAAILRRARPPTVAIAPILGLSRTVAAPSVAAVPRRNSPAAAVDASVRGRFDAIAALPQFQNLVAASPDAPLAVAAEIAELGTNDTRRGSALPAIPHVALGQEPAAQHGPPIE